MPFRRKLKQARDYVRGKLAKDDTGSLNPSGNNSDSSLASGPQQLPVENDKERVTATGVQKIPPAHASSAPEHYPNVAGQPHQPVHATDLIEDERLGMTNESPCASDPHLQAAVATGDTATETKGMVESQMVKHTDLSSDPGRIQEIGSPVLKELRPAQVAKRVPDKKSTTRKGLKGFVRALGPVANLFGPVKEVAELLLECLDKCEMAGEAKSEYDVLRVRLEGLFDDLEAHSGEGSSFTVTASIEGLCMSIKQELSYIKEKIDRAVGQRYVAAPEEADKILMCYRRVEGSVQRLSLNANLSMWKIVQEQASESRLHHMSSQVERLPCSSLAWFDSAEGFDLKRRECTPGTRVAVLATVLDWAQSGSKGAVYWLNGMAGTGKTTIAYTICAELNAGRQLGASFFCSRLREECRNVNMIIPSIAYQLSRFSIPFQSALSSVLEKDPDVHKRLPQMQLEALIVKPLVEVEHTLPDGLVVVIDALDECENKDSTSQMLDILLSRATTLPIKFIVSSRPESEIRDRMTTDRTKARLVLHELDKGEVQTDIETYLRVELAPMNPEEEHIKALVERAGILFIYAATAVRYISYGSFRRNPRSRLRTILDASHTPGTTKHEEIDQLYTTVLKAALGDSRLEPEEREDMRQVLHTVICAREPLTVGVISELLQLNDAERVQAALQPLWSVLHVVEATEIVTTLHASFPDFMFNPTRSRAFHCDSKAHNLRLAELCFESVKGTEPQFNICALESSYLSNKNVPGIEDKTTRSISPALFYSCRYWADHMTSGNETSSVSNELHDFLSIRLLLWMEVLSLKKEMKAGSECMKLTVEWCKALEDARELVELAQDAKEFVAAFASNPVSESTPHIYVSMVAFWPRTSPIAKHYAKYTRGPVEPEGTALDRRQLAHLSTWAFGQKICAAAVSPDGLSLALGVGEDVVVVDSSSGSVLLGPLKGHPRAVQSIAFSPNRSYIITGSFGYGDQDATILGWDTRSGDTVLGPLHLLGHTSNINCLNFSPNCTLIATGSEDKITCLWDAETGNIRYLLRAQGAVYATAFSPDGTQLAAGSRDNLQVWNTHTGNASLGPLTCESAFGRIAFSPKGLLVSADRDGFEIYVWNAQTGEKILGPFIGHVEDITRIGCSPDGRYIVSGSRASDRTVRVWDAQSGNMVLGPLEGHTGSITLVTFTPDGSRIISACKGGLVCSWDAQQLNRTSKFANSPFHRITCAKFLSDGARFVSGSEEGTISIWDAQTGEVRVGPIEAHTSAINAVDFLYNRVALASYEGSLSVHDVLTEEVALGPPKLGIMKVTAIAFSLDGQKIATGFDNGVNVWNAEDGNRLFGPFTGLGNSAASIRFSPNGTRIVAGSWASSANIAVWDVSTGKNLYGNLAGHTGPVFSVSYSPNGNLIASGSADGAIIVWGAFSGNLKKRLSLPSPVSNSVYSVHFSPDGTRLVSGSDDKTIHIWNVQTGEMIFALLSGHDDGIRSVEYSPDGTRILSCSFDMSIRIHDARSPTERALSYSESEVGDWTINQDGWVVDDQSRLLVWVPGDLRKALMWSETRVMISPHGYLRLNFDKSRMGESWSEGFTSGM